MNTATDTVIISEEGTKLKISDVNSTKRNLSITTSVNKAGKSSIIINGNDFSNFQNNEHLLLIVDGKEVNTFTLQNLKPESFHRIAILSGDDGVKRYGLKGKNGVLQISTKNISNTDNRSYIKQLNVTGVATTVRNIKNADANVLTSNIHNKYYVIQGSTTYYDKSVKGISRVVVPSESQPSSIINEVGTMTPLTSTLNQNNQTQSKPIQINLLSPTAHLNKPYIIIDGKPADKKAFRKLQPQDIESMYIFKDSLSTSAYGNKGKNGVVIINTHKS